MAGLDAYLGAIPNSQLNKQPNRSSRINIARSLGQNWALVALPNVTGNDITDIRINHPHSHQQQKNALLEKWVERNGHEATYRQLAKCLYDAEEISTLEVLCRELGATFTTSQPQPIQAQTHIPEPTARELANLVATDQPYRLGQELKVAQRDLSIMKKDYPNDHAGQLSKVLSLYLKQTVYPSWVQVATALWNIGEKKMAKDIADKYGFTLPGISSVSSAPRDPVHPHEQYEVRQRTGAAGSGNGTSTASATPGGASINGTNYQPHGTVDSKCRPWNYVVALASVAAVGVFVLCILQSQGFVKIWPPAVFVNSVPHANTVQTSTTVPPTTPPSVGSGKIRAENDPSPKWLNDEIDPGLLTLIKYTDSEGKESKFFLIKKLQNDCKKLGVILGIDEETLTAFSKKRDNDLFEVCNDIIHEWLKRGVGGYKGTWAGLLEAIDDADLGGVARKLKEALHFHFK